MNVKVRIIETSSIKCGIVYAVLLGMDYELVLDITILKACVSVVDPAREAIVTLCKDLTLLTDGDGADLSSRILGPS